MVQPRPISLTQVNEEDYEGAFEPVPLLIVGTVPGGGGGGGGDVSSVNGKTGSVVLNASDVGAAPTNHTQAISTVTGLTDALAAKASTTDLDNTFGIATQAQSVADEALGKANTAVQPAALATYVPNTRTVAGKPLSANVELTKVDVGLSNVDNTSAANMPVSTAQQAALDAKVPTSRTVAGKALSADVTLAKGDVGLGNVDNTADSAKPVSSATQTALNLKAPLASPAFTGTPTGITKAHVGLSNVDNTADSAKPVSTAQQTALDLKAPLASPTFTGTVSGVTKTHVGLGNVDNTADTAKPVSTAQAAAIAAKVGSPNSTVTGLAYYATVGALPNPGTAGVIYYVDAV